MASKGAWGGKKTLAQVMKENQKDSKVQTPDPAVAAQVVVKRTPLPAVSEVHIAHRYTESDGNDGSTRSPLPVALNVDTTLVIAVLVVHGNTLSLCLSGLFVCVWRMR